MILSYHKYKAMKQHRCDECSGIIRPGDYYHVTVSTDDGFGARRDCNVCHVWWMREFKNNPNDDYEGMQLHDLLGDESVNNHNFLRLYKAQLHHSNEFFVAGEGI